LVATAFYLWPTIQAIRLSLTNATLLRDDAQYTLETYGQTLSDPTLGSVTVANIWRGTAFSMLLLYAGLQTVNRELYEAAAVDGASRVRQFWHVTLPQLRPVLLVNVVLITIATLNTFDMVLALTGGGPAQATEVLALHIYNTVFINFNIASGSVFAVFLLAIYRRLLRAEAL
jgi:multiple sugar transport system permease protein